MTSSSEQPPKEYPKIDTPDPYRHCNHEDYCHTYQMRRMNDIPRGWACPYPCKHDSRPHPAPASNEEIPETCPSYGMCREIAARKAREDMLNELQSKLWEKAFPPFSANPEYQILQWDTVKEIIESLRSTTPHTEQEQPR